MTTTLRSLADLGALVRTARVERNLTQAELAARLGVGGRLLSELEQGERDLRASNLLHVLGRLGFDLQAVPRTAPVMLAVAVPATDREPAAPNRQRVRRGHAGQRHGN